MPRHTRSLDEWERGEKKGVRLRLRVPWPLHFPACTLPIPFSWQVLGRSESMRPASDCGHGVLLNLRDRELLVLLLLLLLFLLWVVLVLFFFGLLIQGLGPLRDLGVVTYSLNFR